MKMDNPIVKLNWSQMHPCHVPVVPYTLSVDRLKVTEDELQNVLRPSGHNPYVIAIL